MAVDPGWVAVGRVTRAHGLHGEVAVLVLSQIASRFEPGSRVFVGESPERPLTVSAARSHRPRLLVRFEGVGDRTSAEELASQYLFVPASEVPPLPEGEFWPHQLVGCEVRSEAGRPLGRIKEIIHTPANDVWVAESPSGQDDTLVPALKDVVVRVDLAQRRVTVRDVPGLTSP